MDYAADYRDVQPVSHTAGCRCGRSPHLCYHNLFHTRARARFYLLISGWEASIGGLTIDPVGAGLEPPPVVHVSLFFMFLCAGPSPPVLLVPQKDDECVGVVVLFRGWCVSCLCVGASGWLPLQPFSLELALFLFGGWWRAPRLVELRYRWC